MELLDAILKRRSIRRFTKDKINIEKIDILLKAAMSAPSAANRKPWEFYVITDEKILNELRSASKYTNYEASLAIIVCGNLTKALDEPNTSYWIQDCSAASENILLVVTDMNLGSVWCGVYPQKDAVDRVSRILELSSDLIPLNIIYIGYPVVNVDSSHEFDKDCIHYR